MEYLTPLENGSGSSSPPWETPGAMPELGVTFWAGAWLPCEIQTPLAPAGGSRGIGAPAPCRERCCCCLSFPTGKQSGPAEENQSLPGAGGVGSPVPGDPQRREPLPAARVPRAARCLQRGGHRCPLSHDPSLPRDHQLPTSGKAFPPASMDELLSDLLLAKLGPTGLCQEPFAHATSRGAFSLRQVPSSCPRGGP